MSRNVVCKAGEDRDYGDIQVRHYEPTCLCCPALTQPSHLSRLAAVGTNAGGIFVRCLLSLSLCSLHLLLVLTDG